MYTTVIIIGLSILIVAILLICRIKIKETMLLVEEGQLLVLSAQRALLHSIIPYVRVITMEKRGDILIVWIYVERALTEDEQQMYYDVAGETAADFLDDVRSEVSFFETTEDSRKLQYLDHVAYARYEELEEPSI